MDKDTRKFSLPESFLLDILEQHDIFSHCGLDENEDGELIITTGLMRDGRKIVPFKPAT